MIEYAGAFTLVAVAVALLPSVLRLVRVRRELERREADDHRRREDEKHVAYLRRTRMEERLLRLRIRHEGDGEGWKSGGHS